MKEEINATSLSWLLVTQPSLSGLLCPLGQLNWQHKHFFKWAFYHTISLQLYLWMDDKELLFSCDLTAKNKPVNSSEMLFNICLCCENVKSNIMLIGTSFTASHAKILKQPYVYYCYDMTEKVWKVTKKAHVPPNREIAPVRYGRIRLSLKSPSAGLRELTVLLFWV